MNLEEEMADFDNELNDLIVDIQDSNLDDRYINQLIEHNKALWAWVDEMNEIVKNSEAKVEAKKRALS